MKQLNTLQQPVASYTSKLMELLTSRKFLDDEQKQVVVRLQKQAHGRSVPQLLIDAGVSEEAVQRAVAELSGLPFIKVGTSDIDIQLVERLGGKWCKEHEIVPVQYDGTSYLAVQSPDAVFLAEELCNECLAGIGAAIALGSELEAAMDSFEPPTRTIEPETSAKQIPLSNSVLFSSIIFLKCSI